MINTQHERKHMPKKDHKTAEKYCRVQKAKGKLKGSMDNCVYGTMAVIEKNRKKGKK